MRKTAGALLYFFTRRNIKILLVHNGKSWSVPKGGALPRETKEETTRREVYEETGVYAPKTLVELGYVEKGSRERLYCFCAEIPNDLQPVPDAEISDAKFFSIDEARLVIARYQLPLLDWLESHVYRDQKRRYR